MVGGVEEAEAARVHGLIGSESIRQWRNKHNSVVNGMGDSKKKKKIEGVA